MFKNIKEKNTKSVLTSPHTGHVPPNPIPPPAWGVGVKNLRKVFARVGWGRRGDSESFGGFFGVGVGKGAVT